MSYELNNQFPDDSRWKLKELQIKYAKLLSWVKDVVYVLDQNLDIQPDSPMHKEVKILLRELGETNE